MLPPLDHAQTYRPFPFLQFHDLDLDLCLFHPSHGLVPHAPSTTRSSSLFSLTNVIQQRPSHMDTFYRHPDLLFDRGFNVLFCAFFFVCRVSFAFHLECLTIRLGISLIPDVRVFDDSTRSTKQPSADEKHSVPSKTSTQSMCSVVLVHRTHTIPSPLKPPRCLDMMHSFFFTA